MASTLPRPRCVLLVLCGMAAIATSACNNHYTADPPIDCNHAGVVPEEPLVIAGSRVTFSAVRPPDKDTSYPISPINGTVKWDSPTLVDDEKGDSSEWPRWHATGGTIIGDSVGVTSITWQAPDSDGSATIRFGDDDLPTPVDTESGDTGSRDDAAVSTAASTEVLVRIPEVISVGWLNTHSMFDVDPLAFSEWDDSTMPLHYPQYDVEFPLASPVCMTKNTSATVVERCWVERPVSFNTTLVVMSDNGDVPFGESQATFTAGNEYASSTHNSVTNTPDEIYCSSVEQNWKYRVPSGSNNWIDMNETSVMLYLTLGTPSGSRVTTKRVEWVCQKAAGETLEPNCVDAIFYGMGLMPVLGSTPPVPLWLLLDPSGTHQADCGYLANFFILCCRMLGVSAPMTKGYIYPLTAGLGGRWSLSSNDTEYRLVTDPPPHAGGFSHPHATYNVVEMLLWSGSEGGTNKYEGAVLYNGKYYCVGFDAYAHPSLAMYALVDKTFWVYQTSSTTWYYCINPPDPGPYPEWDW